MQQAIAATYILNGQGQVSSVSLKVEGHDSHLLPEQPRTGIISKFEIQ